MKRKQSEDELSYRKALRNIDKARRWAFPSFSCPMSRAAICGAERLASHGDDMDYHLAEDIILTVLALWSLRRETKTTDSQQSTTP